MTFERGRPTVALDAPTHTNGKRVTMWVEGYDWARWTFYHKSIATTQSVDISSVGDYLSRVILDFLLWIVLGGFAAGYSCKRALDKAKIGPQYGFTPWIIGLSVVTAIGSVVFYRSITSLVVNARIVLAAYVVAIISIIMLETYSNGDSKALLLRPTLEHAESPTGDLAYDMIDVEGEEITIVRAVDGTVSVVRPGFLPFLARVFGKTARLKNIEQLRTRVPFKNSRWSELFVADPEAEELIHYTPEGWGLDFPELSRETAPTYLMVALGVMIAGAAIHYGAANPAVVVAVTAAGLLTWGATPVEGVAYVEPAPVHLRSAFGTMLQYAEDVDDAKRLDEVKEQLDSERVQKQRDVDEKVAKHDRTLVEEMLDPDNEVPAAVEREEFVDDEVTRHRREESEGAVADGGEPDGDE
ncbi:hypothetical protein BRC92_00365 [Halobacteriales archaeon QS_4_69_31]|nr:MAG: hypothetical protein BRC92_00365 [Halobacteriales archaeon QS_4_69_31]